MDGNSDKITSILDHPCGWKTGYWTIISQVRSTIYSPMRNNVILKSCMKVQFALHVKMMLLPSAVLFSLTRMYAKMDPAFQVVTSVFGPAEHKNNSTSRYLKALTSSCTHAHTHTSSPLSNQKPTNHKLWTLTWQYPVAFLPHPSSPSEYRATPAPS